MDDPASLLILIIFIITLVYLSGWFSGIETALTHLGLVQVANMQKRNVRNIEYIIKLRRNVNHTIIAILIGNNIVNITLSAVAAIVADTLFNTVGVSIAIGIITFLIIMFGEITPKSQAIKESEKIAIKRAKTLYYFTKTINPLIWTFTFLTRHILKLLGTRSRKKEVLITEQHIADLATLGHNEGVLKLIEKDIIHKVFTFGERKTKDIMVPIKKVFRIKAGTALSKAKEMATESGYTRIPVMEANKILGFLYVKDLLSSKMDANGETPVEKVIRKPIIFNSAMHITNTFTEMRKKQIHIAIIEDNRDRHIGILTLEDIIEELVGEIEDEYHKVKHRVRVS